jgi:hypothetical protein
VLAEAVYSADVILNILARRRNPVAPITIPAPPALRLQHEPVANWPLRQFAVGGLMERTEILDLMGKLKLAGMKAAFDEVIANGIKRRHEPQRLIGDAELFSENGANVSGLVHLTDQDLIAVETVSSKKASQSRSGCRGTAHYRGDQP